MSKESKELYFSHDINSSDDIKIVDLISKLDWYGYGVYWRLIELLHKNDNKLPKESISGISNNFKIEKETLIRVLNDFELFNEEDGIYSSNRVARNLAQMADKKIQKRNAIQKRWEIHRLKQELVEYYKEEYRKIFKDIPTLDDKEISKIYEIARNNENFKEKLPLAFQRLSKIEFDKGINYQPFSSWLLEENHYSKVVNGEFSKKEIESIKKSIIHTYKPPERLELSEEEEEEIKLVQEKGKKILQEIAQRNSK